MAASSLSIVSLPSRLDDEGQRPVRVHYIERSGGARSAEGVGCRRATSVAVGCGFGDGTSAGRLGVHVALRAWTSGTTADRQRARGVRVGHLVDVRRQVGGGEGLGG